MEVGRGRDEEMKKERGETSAGQTQRADTDILPE